MNRPKLRHTEFTSKFDKESEPIYHHVEHTVKCTKYVPHTMNNNFVKPLVRACGCVHRFNPTTGETTKSLSGYIKKRSRSCTRPIRAKIDMDEKNDELRNTKIMTRHTSENNLHDKLVTEIREKLQIVPHIKYENEYDRTTQPQRYKTTLYIDLGTSEKKYVEELSLELHPRPFVSMEALTMRVQVGTVDMTIKHTLGVDDNPIKM